MKIYVVRHSIPDYGDWDGYDSATKPSDPELCDKGVEIAQALADWMVDTELVPNFIWASPKNRTLQTAQILSDTFTDAGWSLPPVDLKGSLDSDMSIRKMVMKATGDKSYSRVMIVSHHESIEHGMRVLNLEPWIHLDMLAMGELRMLKVDRKDMTWKEHLRMMPSDFGLNDMY